MRRYLGVVKRKNCIGCGKNESRLSETCHIALLLAAAANLWRGKSFRNHCVKLTLKAPGG